ncbi:CBS domain-containing protein [Daejeonella sp.]|jgi:CBS domain-containing protein|uniref:CBS domain-containing protein n=1 Tax=Daejeonella sp. TaxID=2805397 RepID=UPI0027B9A74A|nr:CBS domain-containing protein [Daejeonella sp.]
MKTIKNIIQNKSKSIYSVTPQTSVLDALQVMMDKNISALLVMEGSELKGIFTERDYARKIILQGKASKETSIQEVMTSKLETVKLNTSIEHCMQIMTQRFIRHLPIVEDGIVVGIISIGDLVKFVIEDQKQTIEQLQSYISS